MTFGEKLRAIRIQRNITQQRMARDLDSSQASITAYENNVRIPSLTTIMEFAEYFHVPPSALLPFDDVMEDGELREIAEMINYDTRYRHLFDLIKTMSENDFATILTVAESLANRQN